MFRKLLAMCEVKQDVLAKRLNVTQALVSKWVVGKGYPRITIIPAIAEALNVSIEEVVNAFAKKGA